MKQQITFLSLFSLTLLFSPVIAQEALIDNYKSIVSNYPDRVNIIMRVGVLLSEKGDYINSEKYLVMATKLDRQNPDVYYNLGVSRVFTGKYNEALESFVKATVFNTNDFFSLINLGNIYNLRNELDLAGFYYDRALEIDPKDVDLLNNIGLLALKKKDYERAFDKLSQSFYFKQDEDIRFNLAVAAWYLNKKERIRELYPVVSPSQKHFEAISKLLKN